MEKIKKYIPSIITFLYGVLVTVTKSPFIGDANVFIGIKGNLIDILISRYYQWTSRVVIEGVLLTVLKSYKGILWFILNILIIFALYLVLKKLFNTKREVYINYIICSSIILYTYNDMFSAGWSATTVNYLWPLVLGLFAFIPIVSILNNENKSNKILFLTIPALLFACNQEQVAALVFGFSLVALIYYYIKNKKINYIILVYILISVIGIVFALTCPGNANRLNSETINWFSDFNKLGIIDKLFLSLNNTFDVLLSRINYIGIMFYLVLSYYFIKNKNKLYILSIILLLGTLIVPLLNIFNLNTLYQLNHGPSMDIIPILILDSSSYITSIVIANIYLIGTIILLYNTKEKVLSTITFIAALLSRMIIGFSPTIFASSYRTAIFMNYLIVITTLILFNSMKLNKKEKKYITILYLLLVTIKFIISYVK